MKQIDTKALGISVTQSIIIISGETKVLKLKHTIYAEQNNNIRFTASLRSVDLEGSLTVLISLILRKFSNKDNTIFFSSN